MSVLTQLITRNHHRSEPTGSLADSQAGATTRTSEILWGAATFVLFVVLGPFSVLAVIAGMLSVIPGEETMEPHHLS